MSELPPAGSLRAWIMALRPPTLLVSVAPVAVASAIAFRQGALIPWVVAAALFGALAIQVVTNLVNDVADAERGSDTEARVGPVRAVQAGLLSPRAVRIGALVFGLLAFACGLILLSRGGWVLVAVGIASLISAVAYTAGPFPLAHHGLGDIFVFVFFGPVAVVTTVWLQTKTLPLEAWAASIPAGAVATAVLVVNHIRDEEEDRSTNKRTLVVRFGRTFGLLEYIALLTSAFLVPLAMVITGRWPSMTLAVLGLLPLAIQLVRRVKTLRGAALNPVLGGTARLMLLICFVLTAVLVW